MDDKIKEIEVTPAMIEAGESVLAGYVEGFEMPATLAIRLYQAMARARPRRSVSTPPPLPSSG